MPLELDYLNWDLGFGHVQTSLNPWAQPSWLRVATDAANTPLPHVIPGDLGTAEACFRQPSGWIACVLRSGLEYVKYQERGYPEVSQSAPEFIPPSTPEGSGYDPPPVVSSDPQGGVSEDATPVAISWDSAVGAFGQAVDIWQGFTQPTPTVFSAPAYAGGAVPSAVTPGGSCSCNSSPCVCGTINGRPALVDPRTGKRCYRRRRRVMLTEGDFNTLLRIATLPNNANVRTALAKAIGRR